MLNRKQVLITIYRSRKKLSRILLGVVIGVHSITYATLIGSSINEHIECHENTEKLISELKSSIEELTNKNKKISIECHELEKGNRELQTKIDELTADIDELTEKISEMEKAKEEERKKNEWKEVKIEATFYSALPEENGGWKYAGINALGGKLKTGSLAIPKEIPLGTEFVIDGLPCDVGTNYFIADDRGGAIKMKGDIVRVDVYVERLQGESDYDYDRRVNNLGRIKTTGKYRTKKQ